MFSSLKSLLGGGVDPNFPFDIGEPVPNPNSTGVWTIHDGLDKSGKETKRITIFKVDKKAATAQDVQSAQHAVKKMRTMRHPSVLRFLGSTDTDSQICMATEYVRPLLTVLDEEDNELGKSWGIYQVLTTVGFLVDQNLVHRNIGCDSIFVDETGDWKLGGFEYLDMHVCPISDLPKPPPEMYLPPERVKGQTTRDHLWSMDMWGLGCLCWEVFNGRLKTAADLKDTSAMPKKLLPLYITLVSTNPKSRPSPQDVIDNAKTSRSSFFKNDFVETNLFLGELSVKDKTAVSEFYQRLPELIDLFPKSLCKTKLLPQLQQAFQFGGAGYQVLIPMLKIGNFLSPEEYQQRIVPGLLQLFSSPDRATRISLLRSVKDFVEFLSPEVITKQIYPEVAKGFGDTHAGLREETVKSMLLLGPKLSTKVLDGQLMQHFAKLQMDERPSIRTNTTVCLGKIAGHLSEAAREKVLAPAFLRATKDSFQPARLAGLKSLTATVTYYTPRDCACRIIPSVAPLMLDPAKAVREAAITVMSAMTSRVEEHAQSMEDVPPPGQQRPAGSAQGKPVASGQQPQQQAVGVGVGGSGVTSSAGAAKLLSWANSAVSSISQMSSKSGRVSTAQGTVSSHSAESVQQPKLNATSAPVESTDDEFEDCEQQSQFTMVAIAPGGDGDGSDWGDGWEAEDVDVELDAGSSAASGPKSMGGSGDAGGWGDDNGWGDDDPLEGLEVEAAPKPKPASKTAEERAQERAARRKAAEERRAQRKEAGNTVSASSTSSIGTKKAGLGLGGAKPKGMSLKKKGMSLKKD
eukprot:m.153101 g.153101  ORF g.153101 m.153101 type:complete len:801 (+) comp14281_c0_seq2:173-2575(+)